MPTNRAAWQDKPGTTFAIRSTPYPDPTTLSPTQILLKPHAWAINPCDVMLQDSDFLSFINYPLIQGEDVAGTVVCAGTAASARFKPHDRVLALTLGSAVGKAEMGGFQEYVVVDAKVACHIPGSMSFAEASVFPLCITTPSHGLFSSEYLGLTLPPIPSSSSLLHNNHESSSKPENGRKSILIWGGSSAVGSNAIQLAVAADLEVFATASPRNFPSLQRLGASKVFDHAGPAVIPDLVRLLDDSHPHCAGIFHAAGPVEPSLRVSRECKGDLFVASATPIPSSSSLPPSSSPHEKKQEEDGGEGAAAVRAKMIFGSSVWEDTVILPHIFGEFLPLALQAGVYKVAPQPMVVEGATGLEGLQEGVDVLRRGVSARKVVVLAE